VLSLDAKEYMEQVRKMDRLIENKMIEKEQWKAIAEGTTTCNEGERVQSSSNQQKMESAVLKMIEIQEEIEKQILDFIKIKREVADTISQLKAVEYDVLHKMYIGVLETDGKGKVYVHYLDFQEVADMNRKTYSWATTTHGRALEEVRKIIEQKGAVCVK